jgi:hypothetical protein
MNKGAAQRCIYLRIFPNKWLNQGQIQENGKLHLQRGIGTMPIRQGSGYNFFSADSPGEVEART